MCKIDLTISQIATYKEEAEKAINRAIKEFHDTTGIVPVSLDYKVERYDMADGQKVVYFSGVKLNIAL